MKRIRSTGIIATVALGLMALFGASSASAAGFVTDSYPATVNAGVTTTATFTLGIATSTCSMTAEPAGMFGPSKANTHEIKCPETLEPNGCKFILHPGSGSSGTFDIGPAGCGPMTLTVSGCVMSVAPQTGLAATYEEVGSGSTAAIEVIFGEVNIKTTKIKGCGASNGTEATVKFGNRWSLTATKGGVSTGLHIASSAIYLEGKESALPAVQPRFTGEWSSEWKGHPFPVFGSQNATSQHLLTLGIRTTFCTSVDFLGETPSPSSELSLTAEYSGCMATGGLLVTMKMNGCYYKLHVSNAGPPYVGTTDVVCPTPGTAIEVKLYGNKTEQTEDKPKCLYKVGSQSGLTGVGFENTGTGLGRGIVANLNLKGISYTTPVGTALLCGTLTGTSGTYSGGSTLTGL